MKDSLQKSYSKICKVCDSVLLDFNSRSEIIAINFLHVIRATPTSLQSYAYLFNNEFWLYRIIRHYFLLIKNIMGIFYNILCSIFYRTQKFDDMTHNADFLFISHYTGLKNGLTHYQDSYFGEMVNQLCQNGKSSVIAYIDESKSNSSNEVFQKKTIEVEKCCFIEYILLEIFEQNVLDKAAFLDLKPFFEKLPGRTGPSRIFFRNRRPPKSSKTGG